jgi:hypothetical protein
LKYRIDGIEQRNGYDRIEYKLDIFLLQVLNRYHVNQYEYERVYQVVKSKRKLTVTVKKERP